jgi:hypothetical protein
MVLEIQDALLCFWCDERSLEGNCDRYMGGKMDQALNLTVV